MEVFKICKQAMGDNLKLSRLFRICLKHNTIWEVKMRLTRFAKSLAIFAITLIAAFCLGMGTTKVEAAYVYNVSDLKQTNATKQSITVSWQAGEGATSYDVYCRGYDIDDEYTLAGNTTATSYTITGLQGGSKYDVKVVSTDGTKESFGSTLYSAITLPDKMVGLKQERWYYFIKSLNVGWERNTAAEGYEVTLYDNKGKKVKTQKLGAYSSQASFNKMKDKVYTVKARYYLTYNGKKYYSAYGSIRCLNQARITKAKVSGKKLTVKWGKIEGATGYQIWVSTKPTSGYKKVATVSKKKSSCTIKKFKGKKFSSKKTYYVYVKTVCNKGKSKNTSGALYYWNTKNTSYGYL